MRTIFIAARIAKALKEWQVDAVSGTYFRMLNASAKGLAPVLQCFEMSIPHKLFTAGDLRSLKASAKVF